LEDVVNNNFLVFYYRVWKWHSYLIIDISTGNKLYSYGKPIFSPDYNMFIALQPNLEEIAFGIKIFKKKRMIFLKEFLINRVMNFLHFLVIILQFFING